MTNAGATNIANTAKDSAACLYGAEYYDGYGRLGPVPYTRENPQWLRFFGKVAEHIVRNLAPRTLLDVGCAKGFLVECLRDRGVEAFGFDVSEYAISSVRADIRPFCWVGSATELIKEHYDLIACIEVCEHLAEADAKETIRQMTSHTDTILFSSTPADFTEPTHVNVRPVIDWLRLFAVFSFAPDETFDARFVSPQAMLLRRSQAPPSDRALCRFAHERNQAVAARELNYSPDVRRELDAILNSRAWKLVTFYRSLRSRITRPIHRA